MLDGLASPTRARRRPRPYRPGRGARAPRYAVEVVAYDADPEVDVSGLEAELRLGAWDDACSTGSGCSSRAPGCRPRPSRSSPPVLTASRSSPRSSSAPGCSRTRSSPSPARTGRRRRARCSARSCEAGSVPVEVAGNIGRALTSARRACVARRLDRLRALLVPARGRDDARAARRRAHEPRARPSRPTRHLRDYEQIKLSLFERQSEDDVAVVPRGFRPVPGAARRVEFAADDPLPAEPRIRGAHNRENAAAATAAARAIGVPDDAIAEALRSFPGVEHRIEEVATLAGVLYVNDSKATNAAAALRALASFAGRRKHVILGGRGKSEPYEALAAAFEPGDRAYLIGEAAEDLAARFRGRCVSTSCRANTLERAIVTATSAASAGDVVLLCPACASFDQFTSFEHRGRSSAASCRSSRGGIQTPCRPRPARAAAPDPRHPRARRVRARDGLQRDVRLRDARRGRPDEVPRQAGPLRRRGPRPPGRALARRLPRSAAARPAPPRRLLRRVRGGARRRTADQRRPSLVRLRAREHPAGRARKARGLRLDVRRPRASSGAEDDGRADEAGRARRRAPSAR